MPADFNWAIVDPLGDENAILFMLSRETAASRSAASSAASSTTGCTRTIAPVYRHEDCVVHQLGIRRGQYHPLRQFPRDGNYADELAGETGHSDDAATQVAQYYRVRSRSVIRSSRSRSNWFTVPGSALPLDFCMTCPTRKFSAPPSPLW